MITLFITQAVFLVIGRKVMPHEHSAKSCDKFNLPFLLDDYLRDLPLKQTPSRSTEAVVFLMANY